MKFNKEKFWENIQYLNLVLCLFGQVTIGWFFVSAQIAYLIADVIAVIRNFALNRPKADKIRDITFTVIALGIIIIKVYGG